MFSEGVNQSKKYEDDDVDMKTVDWAIWFAIYF